MFLIYFIVFKVFDLLSSLAEATPLRIKEDVLLRIGTVKTVRKIVPRRGAGV